MLIPYRIKKIQEVDPDTGESKYELKKMARIYNSEENIVYRAPYQYFDSADFVDETLSSTKAIKISKTDKGGRKKYAIINSADDIKKPLWFDAMQIITTDFIVVKLGDTYGLVNVNLQIKLLFEYSLIEPCSVKFNNKKDYFFILKKGDEYCIKDYNLLTVVPFRKGKITYSIHTGKFLEHYLDCTIIFDFNGYPENIKKERWQAKIKDITNLNKEFAVIKNYNNKYQIYDITKKVFLGNGDYYNCSPMSNGMSLCDNDLLFSDGSVKNLEEGRYCISGNFFYKIEDVDGPENKKISIYTKDGLYSTVNCTHDRHFFWCHIFFDKYLCIGCFVDKYSLLTYSIFDLHGNPIKNSSEIRKQIDEIREAKKKDRNDSVISLELLPIEEQKRFEHKIKCLRDCDGYEIYRLCDDLYKVIAFDIDDGEPLGVLNAYMYKEKNFGRIYIFRMTNEVNEQKYIFYGMAKHKKFLYKI